MRKVITNDLEKCVGCNRCVRVCPIDEANIAKEVNGKIRVEVDNNKCIACDACLSACQHGSRSYVDDTERFFADLKRGVAISMIAAPAIKCNLDAWGRVLTWLRSLDEYTQQAEADLPVIFDVLNCQEGCNIGTGCPRL